MFHKTLPSRTSNIVQEKELNAYDTRIVGPVSMPPHSATEPLLRLVLGEGINSNALNLTVSGHM